MYQSLKCTVRYVRPEEVVLFKEYMLHQLSFHESILTRTIQAYWHDTG